MSPSFLHLSNLTWRWPSQEENLFSDLSAVLEPGWTGLVGENGCGKTTLLRLIAGDPGIGAFSRDGSGFIRGSADRCLCRQRTDDPPEAFEEFVVLPDSTAGRLASRLGIGEDWPWRWDSLSHGERKKAQLATALWMNPDILLVDEPTNHLDVSTRVLLAGALEDFRGIGIIVSHDRELLDRLCSRCLFLESGTAVLRPGGVSRGLEEMEKEYLASRRERDTAMNNLRRLRAEQHRRSRDAAAADRRRSKRNLDIRDSDGRAKLDRARVTGRDGRAGELKRQMNHRIERAEQRSEAAWVKRRIGGGITLAGETSRSDRLAVLESGEMDLGDGRMLRWPRLEVRPGDRIALTGPNGCGKSRLLHRLLDANPLPAGSMLFVPQEIPAAESSVLLNSIRDMSREERGELFSAVDRLGSDPVRLMESRRPSPGETRKLMLAAGLLHRPAWVAMDEPTNHMDLFSAGHLESALAAYGGALLLVSHERRFLEKLAGMEWRITDGEVATGWMSKDWSGVLHG